MLEAVTTEDDMLRIRTLLVLILTVAAPALIAPLAVASLDAADRAIAENRFIDAVDLYEDAAADEALDDAIRGRAYRGLAAALLARDEGSQAIMPCAQAVLHDVGYAGNIGFVKVIERELQLSGVPDGWDETLQALIEEADGHPLLREFLIDLEISTLNARGRFDEADALFAGYGGIDDLLIAGPFPNIGGSGIFERFPPEHGIDIDAVYHDYLGRPFEWEPAMHGRWSRVDLDLMLADEPNAVAYALTHVRVDETTPVVASVFGSGAFRVWINGRAVLRDRTARLPGLSLYESAALLRQGWNRILVKAAAEVEPLAFSLSFYDRDGRTLFLEADSDPSVYDGPNEPVEPIDDAMPTYTFESLPDDSWLRAWRDAALGGGLPDWFGYLDFLLQHGFEYEGEKTLDLAEERFPASAIVAEIRAKLLGQRGEAGEATAIRRRIAEDAPEFVSAVTSVVGELLGQGDLDEAWDKVNEALEGSPKNIGLMAMHGAMLMARGSLIEGMDELSRVFAAAPENIVARTYYLLSLEASGRDAERNEAVIRALEAKPDDRALALQAASIAFQKDDYDEAVEHILHAKSAGERPDFSYLSIGSVYETAGRHEEALAAFENGLEWSPRSTALHDGAARILLHLEDEERALEHYRMIVARHPMAFSQRELIRRLEDRPQLEELFPEDDIESLRAEDVSWVDDEEKAIRLLDVQHVTVYPSGAHEVQRHTLTRILSKAGADIYGSASVPYFFDADQGRIEVARTIKSDGREVAAERGFGEVTFADIEPGDHVELRYVVRYMPSIGLPGEFWHRHFFQGPVPILESRLAILRPKDMSYETEMHGAALEPSTTTHDDWQLDVWEMSKVEQSVAESRMPPRTERVMWLDVSTVQDWARIAEWYEGISRGRLHPGREVIALAEELAAEAEGDSARIHTASNYVRKNMKYEGSGFIESGLVPRSVDDVLETRLGDCKDQSVLIVCLLRHMGIDAHIALVNDRGEQTVPTLPSTRFTHAIVRAETSDGNVYWIDPTDEVLSFPNVPVGLEGAQALIVDPANPVFAEIRLDPENANGSDCKLSAVVSDEGDLTVSGVCDYRGEDAARYRYYALHIPDRLEEIERDIIAEEHPAAIVSASEFEGASDLDADMVLDFEFRRAAAVSQAGDLMILSVPWTVGRVPYNLVSLEERAYPLVLDSWRGHYSEVIELEVPEGYVLASELPAGEATCPMGHFSLEAEDQGGGKIVLRKVLQIDALRVEPGDYAAFRSFLEVGWRAEEQQLVFKRG